MIIQSDKAKRAAIIKVLDEEGAWEHVIMNYLSYARRSPSLAVPFRTNGQPDQRRNVGRLMVKLNAAIDGAMVITDPARDEELT